MERIEIKKLWYVTIFQLKQKKYRLVMMSAVLLVFSLGSIANIERKLVNQESMWNGVRQISTDSLAIWLIPIILIIIYQDIYAQQGWKHMLNYPIGRKIQLLAQHQAVAIQLFYLLSLVTVDYLIKYVYVQQLTEKYSNIVFAYEFSWEAIVISGLCVFVYALILMSGLSVLAVLEQTHAYIVSTIFIGVTGYCWYNYQQFKSIDGFFMGETSIVLFLLKGCLSYTGLMGVSYWLMGRGFSRNKNRGYVNSFLAMICLSVLFLYYAQGTFNIISDEDPFLEQSNQTIHFKHDEREQVDEDKKLTISYQESSRMPFGSVRRTYNDSFFVSYAFQQEMRNGLYMEEVLGERLDIQLNSNELTIEYYPEGAVSIVQLFPNYMVNNFERYQEKKYWGVFGSTGTWGEDAELNVYVPEGIDVELNIN